MIRVLRTRSGAESRCSQAEVPQERLSQGALSEKAFGKRFALLEWTELQLGLDRVRGGFIT